VNLDCVPGDGAPRCWRIVAKQLKNVDLVSDRGLQGGDGGR
jgi:hypothetical protein